MSIDPLKVDRAALQQSATAQAELKGVVRDRDAGGDPAGGDQVLLSANPDARYKQSVLRHEQDHLLAGAVRHSDRALKALSQKIDALKAPLETIVKNFPPFAPQDKARMELLRQYSSLRKEIDRLTLPPPPGIAQARSAPELPDPLASGADDSQIADHLAKLDASRAAVSEQRAALAADTASFLQQRRFLGTFLAPKRPETPVYRTDLAESSALQKSVEIGRQFAKSVSHGVTVDHSKFLKGLS
jgi:hypothetical protein